MGNCSALLWLIIPVTNTNVLCTKMREKELKVGADTLNAILSIFSGTLYQKEAVPFTTRDVELRKKVLEMYPRSRPTPFPWSFSDEPKFEVKQS